MVMEISVARESFETFRVFAAVGLGLVIGVYTFSKAPMFKKSDPTKERLNHILDPVRVESYTTEQFQAAIAEASVLIGETAARLMGVNKLEDLQKE
jgi:hypothetical protein